MSRGVLARGVRVSRGVPAARVTLLAGVVDKFVYLKLGLSLVLIFIGGKMLLEHFVHLPIVASLGVVGAVLAASILASLRWPREGH